PVIAHRGTIAARLEREEVRRQCPLRPRAEIGATFLCSCPKQTSRSLEYVRRLLFKGDTTIHGPRELTRRHSQAAFPFVFNLAVRSGESAVATPAESAA